VSLETLVAREGASETKECARPRTVPLLSTRKEDDDDGAGENGEEDEKERE